ncbi:hypothetical protein BJ322DRAFT_560610 [Thelephora terrestris]|jgi:hypothetical protein|uniref:BHLH domain-containing protein n=1 Tax=Thelephora terrestris TaxID=56493 RepID=A0A9P6HLB8_9AGAM|nr:hypothetical protein BJ322DRAFT_560610 [Thelephora terrestris]
MATSVQIPSSPSDSASTSPSTQSSPLTPPSISQSLSEVNVHPDTIPPAPSGKRKPSRRANTAERRATHNAVERQRRETLNGRFLDLAALLPNLSQIRRPSKSSIVNSSIAHIHASRHHRLIAARELRILKAETDALRRELNEWRDQSGVPRLEEPARGDGFHSVLSGEVEVVLPAGQQEDDQNMEDDEDDFHARSSEDAEDVAHAAVINVIKRSQSPVSAPSPPSHQFVHNAPPLPVQQNCAAQPLCQQAMGGSQLYHAHSQLVPGRQHPHTASPQHIPPGRPIIATHQSQVSYENPAMIYDSCHPSRFGYNVPQSYTNGQLPPHILAQLATEADQKATPGWYSNSTGQFTPPNSSGGTSPGSSPFDGGFSNGFPISQQPRYMEHGMVGRERSDSIGSRASPIGNYELFSGARMDNMARWREEGLVGVPGPNPTAYSLVM